MELYQLRSFVVVSRTGNLTRAARELNISQSALSTQIRLLEEELGIGLFVRTARGMTLSDEGSVLLDAAINALSAADELAGTAARLRGTLSGVLKIGLNTDPAFLRVKALNQVLARDLPHVDINFIATETPHTPDMLRNRTIDVGFLYGDSASNGDITRIPLSRVTICAAIPKTLANAVPNPDLAALSRLPWIWTSSLCPFHTQFQKKLDRLGLVPRQVANAFDETIVRELVADGVGVALMREDEATDLADKGLVTIWPQECLDLPLNLAWLTCRSGERLVKTVIRVIQDIWSGNELAIRISKP
ncbi:MAG: LysR family transcriptional regulator [Pseudomonadota bacterium]